MNYKKFIHIFLTLFVGAIVFAIATSVYIDPFFHYGKPNPKFFYKLKQQRYQNDGILRHFEYDAIITGTSMTENFKASELDGIFDVKSIKVSYSGGSFKEINDAISVAYRTGHNVKVVIRALDYYKIMDDKDAMRNDLGSYPTYLYNDNIFDDVKYILNKDVLIRHSIPKIVSAMKGQKGGITDFDTYSNWNKSCKFGREHVLEEPFKEMKVTQVAELTDSEIKRTVANIEQNVIALAKANSETMFYYFFPPYSVAWWGKQMENGEIGKWLAAEKMAIEMMLECPNIKIFSFNLMTDIGTNFDNYKDSTHYGEWIIAEFSR